MKRFLFVVIICCCIYSFLTGCGESVEKEPGDEGSSVVNFRAIYLGNAPDEGMDELYRQLDELTVKELGCTLRFEFIPWGNERKQLNIAIVSGEYDFIPGGVFSDYRTLVGKNAFLNLNDYLYLVPDLVEHYQTYSESALKDCEISGGLYGIPQFSPGGIKNSNEGFFYREDLGNCGNFQRSQISIRWKHIYTGQKRKSSTVKNRWSQTIESGSPYGCF